MLRKLLKYELQATVRLFGVLYLGLLVAAGLTRLFIFTDTWSQSGPAEMSAAVIAMFTGIAYGLLVGAVCVGTIIIIIQRFYKNLLGSEGYLMHTLPVTSWTQVGSKLIVATLWSVCSVIAVVLSIAILTGFREFWSSLVRLLSAWGVREVLSTVQLILCFLVGGAILVVQIYACMMVGHQAKRHRVLMSVVAYFALQFIIQMLCTWLFQLLLGIGAEDALTQMLEGLFRAIGVNGILWCVLLVQIIFAVIFYVITCVLMNRKLNLE